ncbi:MAG TPA: hypothetical protein VE093_21770 [Polyangiaceae bacterium]|jgi:hypothetical protein|nr:hypothetical protein [Polyangiaceae bacterium]
MPPSQKVDRIRALWRTVRSSGSSMSADAPDADERELALWVAAERRWLATRP